MIRRMLSLLLLLAACGLADGAMYKWVDAKGVTHYSEDPPPDGKAQKVDIKPNGPAQATPSTESWQDKEREMRRQLLERGDKEDARKAREERTERQRRARCLQARHELQVLAPGHPVYQVNEKGERVYLEDAEREAEARRWRKEAETWCSE